MNRCGQLPAVRTHAGGMFACSVPAGVGVKVQAEALADAHWFAPVAALDAFPVATRRAIFEACMAEMDPAAGKYRPAA